MTTKFETSMGSTTTSTAPRGPASTPTPTQKPANAKVSMIARRLRMLLKSGRRLDFDNSTLCP